MSHQCSAVLLALFLINSGCDLRDRKKVYTMTLEDLLHGSPNRIRAGCESLFPSARSEAERCVKSTLNSAVVAELCGRIRFDGGDLACVSLMKISGNSLVLEGPDSIYLVVDGASALDW